MGSEAVQSLHEAALAAAHFEDHLFCNELLCTEALDPFAPPAVSSPLPPWPGLQHAASSILVSDYGDFCSWSSSPPWSSSLTTATTSSITSYSCSPSHDLQIQCLQDDHLHARFPPRSCSKFSLCSAASTGPNVLFACMHPSSFQGELEAGSCGLVDHRSSSASLQASDEEQASAAGESMHVLLERQQWPHCRPLKVYAESMQQCSSPANYIMYGASCTDISGAAYKWPMVRRRAVQCMLEVAKMMRMSLLNVGQAVAYLDRYLSHLIKERCRVSSHQDIHMVGVACLWIAFKLEHSNAPDAAAIVQSLASTMFHNSTEDGITTLKSMEANVLQALQWRLLGTSAVEFVDTIISLLRSAPAYICQHPFQTLQSRAHEIVQGTLLEVVFARYEARVVGVCAIQHAVEEIWPLQAASIMHSIHKIVSLKDMREANKCYKDMGDLVVDPLNTQLASSSPISHLYPAASII